MVAINRLEKIVMPNMLALCRIRGEDNGRGVKQWLNAPANFAVPREGWPTEAPPGTIEKLLVMIARERRKEDLFHKWDAKVEGCERPLLFYLAQYELRQEASGRV